MGYEYPPPDPDGRPHIWIVFDFGKTSELDLGECGGAMATIKKRKLDLSEGVGVILFDDGGDVCVLIDAVVDRFNPQRDSWIVRLDWSTYRDMPKPGSTDRPARRRVTDRPREGSDAPGGAGRDAEGDGAGLAARSVWLEEVDGYGYQCRDLDW